MAQDVVGGRDEEEEIRQPKLPQIVDTLQLPLGPAGRPADDLVLGPVDLRARQRLHERQRILDALFRGREGGVVNGGEIGPRYTGQTTGGETPEIRRLTDLPRQAEHVGIET